MSKRAAAAAAAPAAVANRRVAVGGKRKTPADPVAVDARQHAKRAATVAAPAARRAAIKRSLIAWLLGRYRQTHGNVALWLRKQMTRDDDDTPDTVADVKAQLKALRVTNRASVAPSLAQSLREHRARFKQTKCWGKFNESCCHADLVATLTFVCNHELPRDYQPDSPRIGQLIGILCSLRNNCGWYEGGNMACARELSLLLRLLVALGATLNVQVPATQWRGETLELQGAVAANVASDYVGLAVMAAGRRLNIDWASQVTAESGAYMVSAAAQLLTVACETTHVSVINAPLTHRTVHVTGIRPLLVFGGIGFRRVFAQLGHTLFHLPAFNDLHIFDRMATVHGAGQQCLTRACAAVHLEAALAEHVARIKAHIVVNDEALPIAVREVRALVAGYIDA